MRTNSLSIALSLVLCACKSSGSDTGDADGSSGADETTATDPTATGDFEDCGNDLVEAGEECDGADLAGQTCADIDAAFDGGTLVCGASCTFDASGCTLAPGTPLVALNEVTSDNLTSGPAAGSRDAIELHNAGTAPADLSGWKLSDDPKFSAIKTYVFPEGSTLEAGEFLVLTSQDPLTMEGDYPFGINDSAEETLTLADASDAVIDSVVVDGYRARISYCRLPDGTGAWDQCVETFGAANQLAATACGNGVIEDVEVCDGADLAGASCEGLGLGYDAGSLVCSPKCEFDADGCTTTSMLVINELEATADNIELFNAGGAPVDLSGWILTDNRVDAAYDLALDAAELVFPNGTMIGAGQYLVVPLGMGPLQHPFGLGVTGDRVVLAQPDPLTVVDQVTYGDGEATVSYCRQPNGPGGAWMAGCGPTMGAAN